MTGPGFIGALMVSLMMWAAIGLIVWLVVAALTASVTGSSPHPRRRRHRREWRC